MTYILDLKDFSSNVHRKTLHVGVLQHVSGSYYLFFERCDVNKYQSNGKICYTIIQWFFNTSLLQFCWHLHVQIYIFCPNTLYVALNYISFTILTSYHMFVSTSTQFKNRTSNRINNVSKQIVFCWTVSFVVFRNQMLLISVTGLFAEGHFAVGLFAVRTLRREDFSPCAFSPYWQLAFSRGTFRSRKLFFM